jgi:UDP-N-acetylmuramyl tripeptide synthase
MADHTSSSAELEFVERPISRKATSALALRVAGADLEDIVEVVGFASTKEAANAIDRALREKLDLDPEAKSRLRTLTNRRLERLLRSVWTKATTQTSPDHLQAVGKAREIIADHRKLFGLDAPSEMVVHNPNDSEIEQWVMGLLGKAQGADLEEADILEAEVVAEETE